MLKEQVLNTIDSLYRRGAYEYVLASYVNRDFWVDKIRNIFPDNYVRNDTDFNYSTCFTTYIAVSDVHVDSYNKDFDRYLDNNNRVYYIGLEISSIAPYATFKYYYVTLECGQRKVYSRYTPFSEKDEYMGQRIKELLEQEQITLLQDIDLLATPIHGVSLELRTTDVTVYHCLFADGDFDVKSL